MATVQQIINRSYRILGAIGSGVSPTTDETADALTALNAMLDGWMNDKLMVYSQQNITVPLVAGTASYTIGASGATVTATAPVKVDYAFVRKSNLDYQVKLIDDLKYDAIVQKTATSDIPEYAYFNATHPNATITVFPVPNAVNNLYLSVWTPYTAIAAATETFSLPNGYEEAVVYNLAIRLAPEFPTLQLNPAAIEMAKQSLASIKRVNQKPVVQTTQLLGLLNGASKSQFNIITG